MKLRHLTHFIAYAALVIGSPFASSQAVGAPNPAPKAEVTIETVQVNGDPQAKFTNHTADDLAIIFDNQKVLLKSGEAKSIPFPQQQVFDLKIFEMRKGDGPSIQRFEGKATRNGKKLIIPFPWANPNK
jgi:hypothetical protein